MAQTEQCFSSIRTAGVKVLAVLWTHIKLSLRDVDVFGSRGVGYSREGDGRVKETLLEVLTATFRCGYKRLQEKE